MFINMEFEVVSIQYNCIALIESKLDHKIITGHNFRSKDETPFGLVVSYPIFLYSFGFKSLFP